MSFHFFKTTVIKIYSNLSFAIKMKSYDEILNEIGRFYFSLQFQVEWLEELLLKDVAVKCIFFFQLKKNPSSDVLYVAETQCII